MFREELDEGVELMWMTGETRSGQTIEMKELSDNAGVVYARVQDIRCQWAPSAEEDMYLGEWSGNEGCRATREVMKERGRERW